MPAPSNETDHTDQIQAALNEGHPLPSGKHVISRPLVVTSKSKLVR